MPPFREFELIESGTRKHLGTLLMSEACLPGDIVLRFQLNTIQVEALPPKQPFEGTPGVHDERGRRRKKEPAA